MSAASDADLPLLERVYRLLTDQQFHASNRLALECGVSRSAIAQAIGTLRTLGVTVHAVARRGYRLPRASLPLQAEAIRKALPAAVQSRLRLGSSLWSTGSTNADLLMRHDLPCGQFDFLTAEYQSAGRGRRRRNWYAPPGGAICLSMSWSFAKLPPAISALTLAVGVCALRALRLLGIAGVELKWPNDLVVGEAKLGGILAELRIESDTAAFIVIGIGLNVTLGAVILQQVKTSGTEAIDLASLGLLPSIARNSVVATLLSEIVPGLVQFEREGFGGFAQEWRAADALSGKAVQVQLESGIVVGHARGIDFEGALCVQTLDGLQRFMSGDVSVRAVA